MTWLKLCDLAELPDGKGKAFVVTDECTVALFKVEGELFAIDDRCSHAEASLAEGEVFDCEVECPRHGAAFDLNSGKPQSLPATVAVKTYPVRVEGTEVSIDLGEIK